MTRTVYQLEIGGESATLYLLSTFGPHDAEQLRGLCTDLPRTVRVLRVDLHSVAAMSDDTLAAMRTLVRHWRASGRADVRLSFRTPHIVATLSADASNQFVLWSLPRTYMAREAFTAAYI